MNSRQIRDLEDELGFTLFERGRHGARLTAAGLAFRRKAVSLLGDLTEAIEQGRAVARGEAPTLRMGYSQAAAPRIHDQVVEGLAKLNIHPRGVREVVLVRTVLLLIEAGEGFGALPASISTDHALGIRRLPDLELGLDLSTWAFWRRLSPAAERMLDELARS